MSRKKHSKKEVEETAKQIKRVVDNCTAMGKNAEE